jgi:hypothetical protein
MKFSSEQKAIIKSYLRSLAAASVATGLALIADVRPDLSILAGAIVAPIIRYFDSTDQSFGRKYKGKVINYDH